MDAVYIYRDSTHDDFEIRYSLRSLARYAPYIRKVWIFGDKPYFISDNLDLIQHVPHQYTARLVGVKTPVINFGLLMVLASLIPELNFEYLQFSDDHLLLKEYPVTEAKKMRYINDLRNGPLPNYEGPSKYWQMSLWRTAETLTRLKYPAYNFETHTPRWMTRKMVFEAYSEFRQFFSDDRFFGFCGPTGILNHACKHGKMELTNLGEENQFCGFWRNHLPQSCEDVHKTAEGKTFFNYDGVAFGTEDFLKKFMMDRFPDSCKYENPAKTKTEAKKDEANIELLDDEGVRDYFHDFRNYINEYRPGLSQELGFAGEITNAPCAQK
ncbi:hypothetical protein EGT07_10030 [Herbaspirillum sp. HC18]|nr:hypothetical protein EGT07_10030 [Herbaspirillum sp. HC18]